MAYIVNDASHGIIVVDACSLKSLCPQVDHGYIIEKGKGIKRYLDMLRFLAGNGFHIIIPEMVAFECGDMGTKGKPLNMFFGKTNEKRASSESHFGSPRHHHTEEKHQLQIFLQLVRDNRIPNIEMLPTEGPTDEGKNVKAYVEELRRLAQLPLNGDNREELMNFLKTSDADQFGDYEIEHVVTSLHNKGVASPIYVLTEDITTLCPTIQKNCPYATVVNANGLVDAITGNSLNRFVGITKKTSAVTLNTDRYHKVVQYQHGAKGPHDLYIIDHTNACKLDYLPLKRPFNAAMHALSVADNLATYDNIATRHIQANPIIGRKGTDYTQRGEGSNVRA